MKTAAVLIDLDGTLVDTLSEIQDAANAMLADAGRAPIESPQAAELVGEGAAILVERLMGPGSIERWLPVYLAHYRKSNGTSATLYPNVREALGELRRQGLSVACVTNKPKELVGPLFDVLDIASCFDAVVGGGDTARKKPHPEPLLFACAQMKVDPKDAVMVGDSRNDAIAARAAGMPSLTVPYGYPGAEGEAGRAHALLARGVTDTVVDDLLDAARWIAAR